MHDEPCRQTCGDSFWGAGQDEGRVGWRWCLDSLAPVAGPEEEAASGQPMDQRTKLLALLRNLG